MNKARFIIGAMCLAVGLAALPSSLSLSATDVTASAEYLAEAVELIKKGDIKSAVIQLRNSLQANPDNLEARFLLGQIYLRQGDSASAEKELSRVNSAKPNDEVQLLLGQALLQQQKYDGVLATVTEEATSSKTTSAKLILRGSAELGLNHPDSAEALFNRAAAAQPDDPAVKYAFAQLHFVRGELDKADEQLTALLKASPSSFDGWLLKSEIANRRGDVRSALESLDQAAAIAPADPRIPLARAQSQLRGGNIDAADRLINEVLSRQPNLAMARYLQCMILVARGDFQGASRAFGEIEDELRDYPPSLLLGAVIRYETGQFARAEVSFARYAAQMPGSSEVLRLLALSQLRQGNATSAIETLNSLLERDPTNTAALHLLASAQLRAGNYAEAAEAFERAAKTGSAASRQEAQSSLALLGPALGLKDGSGISEGAPTDEKVAKDVLLVMDYLKTGEFEDALKKVQELRTTTADNPLIENLAGGVFLAKGDDAAARERFEAALALDPNFVPAMVNLDRLDIRAGNIAKVERRMRDRVTAAPADERGILALARLLIQQQKIDEAVRFLQQKRTEVPTSSEIVKLLARTQLTNGDKAGGVETAESLTKLGPTNPNLQLFVAQVNFEAGDSRRAIEVMRGVVQQNATDVPSRLALAQFLSRAGRFDEAEVVLNEVRRDSAENVDAVAALVNIAVARGQSERALEQAASFATINPVVSATLQGDVLIRMKQPQKAVEVLTAAFQHNPASAVAIELAVARREAGQQEEAIAGLRQWLETHPTDVGAHRQMAELLLGKRDYSGAVAEYEQVLTQVPYDFAVLNNLAWLKGELGSAQAIPLARRAYLLAPKSPEVADTLGWLLVTGRNIDEGIKLLREAAAALPLNADVQFHLAYALNESKDREGALEILKKILAPNTQFHEREAAEALFTRIRG